MDYSGKLITRLVWYSGGQKLSDPQMGEYLNTRLFSLAFKQLFEYRTGISLVVQILDYHLNTGQLQVHFSDSHCSSLLVLSKLVCELYSATLKWHPITAAKRLLSVSQTAFYY